MPKGAKESLVRVRVRVSLKLPEEHEKLLA